MPPSEHLLDPDKPVAEIFCLCKSAEVADGAVNIIGASTRLLAVPRSVVVPQVTAVVSVRFPIAREGSHEFRVTVTDLHGKPVGASAGGFANVEAFGNDVYAWMQLAVAIANDEFNVPGDFRFDLWIDGELLATSLLCVVRG